MYTDMHTSIQKGAMAKVLDSGLKWVSSNSSCAIMFTLELISLGKVWTPSPP